MIEGFWAECKPENVAAVIKGFQDVLKDPVGSGRLNACRR